VAGAELTVLFGLIVLTTGPLWARKAWGVWWQWDARLTSSLLLFLMLVAYMLARRYGGPAGRKLSAALALFAAIDVPLVYKSVDIWRTVHPKTTVVPSLDPRMRPAFWSSFLLITLLWGVLLALRVRLERQRALVAALRLDADDLLEASR
jgi:heme exporter protein C